MKTSSKKRFYALCARYLGEKKFRTIMEEKSETHEELWLLGYNAV
jgi:hypothetical protein